MGSSETSGAWRQRLWSRVLLAPSSRRLPCEKQEVQVPYRHGAVQLWHERSPDGESTHVDPPELLILRLLGRRGRAELATQDPSNRLKGVRSITWTLNPPGFGGSSGPITVAAYVGSVVAAYDFLAARFAGVPIWVYGKSIGGTAAMYLAAHRPVSALVAKNLIDVPATVHRRIRPWVPRAIGDVIESSIPAEFRPRLWSHRSSCPALFVISTADRLSWPHMQDAVVASYAGVATVLQVAGTHDDQALVPEDEARYASAINSLWKQGGNRNAL